MNGVPDNYPRILGFVEPTEVLIGVLLIATGFILGLSLASIIADRLAEYGIAQKSNGFELKSVFGPTVDHGAWNPAEIRRNPSVDELATQEERVLRLLIANGGRMPQSDLSSDTGWSKAKVSRLLNEMEERGDISRVHIGRSNLIVLGRYGAHPEVE